MDHAVEHEHRFLLSSTEARRFTALISQYSHLDVYNQERPAAYTRTTYFDTPDRRYWRDENQGVSRRVRLRQYATAATPHSKPTLNEQAYLELKESCGAERRKLRHAANATALDRYLSGQEVDPALTGRLMATPTLYRIAMAIRSGALLPAFTTWYRRVSMSTEAIRFTIDENVSFCSAQKLDGTSSEVPPAEILNVIGGRIVEVKIRGEAPTWLADAMAELSGMETPSKFRRGMALMGTPRQAQLASTRPLMVVAPMRSRLCS